jgi:tRNA-dihydrouridine synthase B
MNNFWQKIKKPILALAPMAGITDSAFREICRKHGANVVYSEMASVSALSFKPQKTLELLEFKKSERPYVVQLFGKDPVHFAKAARIVSEIIKPDGVDINFGCPAKKVFGHGSGCALMPQKKLAREIILAVLENTDLPVSIKIRAGVRSSKVGLLKNSQSPTLGITAIDFIKNIKDLDFRAVMVHCRTYEKGFSGTPDYSIAEKIKKIIPDKIVLANGGIMTPEDGVKILKKYKNIDGLGIARGALGRPWIFKEIAVSFPDLVGESSEPNIFKRLDSRIHGNDISSIKKIAIEHSKLLYKNKGERGLFEIRKHLVWYFKGFPGASDLRKKLVQAKSLQEIKNILK